MWQIAGDIVNSETFTNEPVEASLLPDASTLQYEALAPSYARTMVIEWIAAWILMGIVAAVINFFIGVDVWFMRHWWITVPYAIIALSAFAWAPMIAKSRGYSARDKDIHYKSGIVWHKTVSLPFNRIQHVELESGPLERLFKLTTLKFFTAGGGSADMKIPALTFGKASKLRAFVMEKAGVEVTNSESETHDIA